MTRIRRLVWFFGDGKADGSEKERNLLGGKGAGLAEMTRLGLPVPPGMTIGTDVCIHAQAHGGAWPDGLDERVQKVLPRVERIMGRAFGDALNPLLLSVRSGARVSMPGMMDTVLNLGLNEETVEGLAFATDNPRFAWDSYRRFAHMFGDVVLGIRDRRGEDPFEKQIQKVKARRGIENDTELTVDNLKRLVADYKAIIEARSDDVLPDCPGEQLRQAIDAVFRSWNNDRAIAYRELNDIPHDWGTAVSVQAMVFGNLGPESGTGVAFTRDPGTGAKHLYGEYLVNAQGEDVVAGVRTPVRIAEMAQTFPGAWRELGKIQHILEDHYRDMQDLEFTVEHGRLWLLQTRSGKRTGQAAVRIAVDMAREGRISKNEAVTRVPAEAVEHLMRPEFETAEADDRDLLATGLGAGPGAATGKAAFTARAAVRMATQGTPVILVRTETSPEDIRGMAAAEGILTQRGGMTSHAALVGRQMGKVCVVGCGEILVDSQAATLTAGDRTIRQDRWISIDGSTGQVFAGRLPTRPSRVLHDLLTGARHPAPDTRRYRSLMAWADRARRLKVRANADQADQCDVAVALGAQGIGLCRTEHMFFGEGKIDWVRAMILADSREERRDALRKLLPLQRRDFEGVFMSMGTRPVTIRTLDPPLHEFLPQDKEAQRGLARTLGISVASIRTKVDQLHEANPMLGNRGCRLGILYPEITEMQARAIFEAACNVKAKAATPRVEVMIPLVSHRNELQRQADAVREAARAAFERKGTTVPYLVGTMIELPRAALTADRVAEVAEFFSFGTNDLTQTTFGFSRDDAGTFLEMYTREGILDGDPFRSIDVEGVGNLMRLAVERGRSTRGQLKIGICGEHGGDPPSVAFCHGLGLDYVSCSPFRIPVARLAAAQAALADGRS